MEKMITIRLPKELCTAVMELAQFAGETENMDACYAIAHLFRRAAEKGEIELVDPALSIYKPYDEKSDQGGWNWENVNQFSQALREVLGR